MLILNLSKINSVVLLVDEYDKPILDNIVDGDGEVTEKKLALAKEIRSLLSGFYLGPIFLIYDFFFDWFTF